MSRDVLTVRTRGRSHIGRERGERVVELVPGHRLGASPVAQPVRRFTRQVERIGDAGQALRRRWRQDGPLPAGIGERDQVAGQVAAVDRGDILRIERAQIARVVPVVEMPAEPVEAAHGGQRRLQPLDRLGGSRSTRNRGRLAVDRRYRPRLVGEVRCASAGTGSSWKLSGGSMWSAAVTKVSKNRQVRRAISRRACASASDTDIRPALRGGRLVQRAIAGEAIHRAASGTARGHVPCPNSQGDQHRQNADDDPAGHHAIEAEEVEPGTDRRLRRRNPFEQMPAGDEQPHQGPRDRIAHQPRLMRQEDDDKRRLGQREAQIGAERAEMAARRDPGAAWQDGGDDRDEGRQHDRREHESRSRRARPSSGIAHPASKARTASRRRQRSPQIVEHLPAADRRNGAALSDPCRRLGPRPKIHGSSCQSPRAQRWWRMAATS